MAPSVSSTKTNGKRVCILPNKDYVENNSKIEKKLIDEKCRHQMRQFILTRKEVYLGFA